MAIFGETRQELEMRRARLHRAMDMKPPLTEDEARSIDLSIAKSLEGKLCEGCPPPEFPNAPTRCLSCPRRPAMENDC